VARIILATGGTGGHIFPALAVAEELKKRNHKDKDIVFIGGKYGQEKRIITEAGFQIYVLPVKGILGKGIKAASSLVLLSYSMLKCMLFLKRFKPDIVVGFGGYASFVPVYLATKMGIQSCIHEQNSYPGFTNRFLGKRVDRIFLSFPDKMGIFDEKKTVVTGNPVREGFLQKAGHTNIHLEGANKRVNLLVVGGSQGAKAINDAVIESLSILKRLGIKIYHQTGKLDYKRVFHAYNAHNIKDCRVVPFILDMADAYQWADLVVCRAGASTIFEICIMGKPSILIPYPYAANNHQRVNARFLEEAGGAIVIEQSFLERKKLGSIVADLIAIPGKLKEMGRAAKAVARPDATKVVVDNILEMINSREK